MAAKYIMVAVAAVLFTAAGVRIMRDGGRLAVASKIWLFMGIIFMLVGLWLWGRV